MVGGSGKGLEQSHGDLLFSSFKSSISTCLAKSADLSIAVLSAQASTKGRKVSSILVTVVDHVTRDKVIRKRCVPYFVVYNPTFVLSKRLIVRESS